ncbi:MAG TPA: YlxR family protein [Promineifilum sp.]|nr:YlxR family protein [Promineifilum sp.]
MTGTQSGHRKHIPQRTCVVCRRQFDKRRLTRIVRTPPTSPSEDGGVLIDPTGKQNGRGAYLCDQAPCWDKVIRQAGILNQALNAQVTDAELATIAASSRRPTAVIEQ